MDGNITKAQQAAETLVSELDKAVKSLGGEKTLPGNRSRNALHLALRMFLSDAWSLRAKLQELGE